MGGRRALRCRCVGKEADSPFVRCCEEVDYEGGLVQFLAWMSDQGDGLADKPNLEYFLVLQRFDGLSYVYWPEYWARDCDFEMHMRTNRMLVKTFAGWPNVEVFALHLVIFQ